MQDLNLGVANGSTSLFLHSDPSLMKALFEVAAIICSGSAIVFWCCAKSSGTYDTKIKIYQPVERVCLSILRVLCDLAGISLLIRVLTGSQFEVIPKHVGEMKWINRRVFWAWG